MSSKNNYYDHNLGVTIHPGEQFSPTPMMAVPGITVDELAKLATAGVKIELTNEIAQYVRPNPPPEGVIFDATPLTKPLLQRWKRYQDIVDKGQTFMQRYPFFLSAWSNGQTVYVFVCPLLHKASPLILTDEALLYPSDALMSKLHLLCETHPKRDEGEIMGGVVSSPPQMPYGHNSGKLIP